MKGKEQYYTGNLASYFGVSRDTIRLYDKRGPLPPSRVGENRYRIYSREDLICMEKIHRITGLHYRKSSEMEQLSLAYLIKLRRRLLSQ